MAPEILNDYPYDFSVDVWSSGIIFLEILKCDGKLIFNGKNKEKMFLDIKMKIDSVVPSYISQQTKDLIMSMLNDPDQRPTFA